jgi:hypothetical protein
LNSFPDEVDRGSPLFPQPSSRHRLHGGLTERQEHIFTWFAVVVVLLYAALWVAAIAEIRRIRNTPVAVIGGDHREPAAAPPSPLKRIAESVITPPVPKPAFLSEAVLGFVHPLRGKSGQLRYAPALPGSKIVQATPGGSSAIIGGRQVDFTAPAAPGIYDFTVQVDEARREIENMSVVTLVPRSQKRGGKIGPYRLGSWPYESGGKPKTPRYAAPAGFIEVTPNNQNFHVSQHFQLRQFLTKDQRRSTSLSIRS